MGLVEEPCLRIGFSPHAGEAAERMIGHLETYCVQITTPDGLADYIVRGYGEWDGHQGYPVKVQAFDGDVGTGVGPIFEVDALYIYVY